MLNIRNNVIARAELRHQWYVMAKSRSGAGWIALATIMLLPAFLTGLAFFVAALIGDGGALLNGRAFEGDQEGIGPRLLSLGITLLVTMNVALYAVVTMVTVGLAGNSITRERHGRTWDALLLTNIDARQIVLGKWWATLMALWGDHLMIGLLRIGLIAYLLVAFSEVIPTVGDLPHSLAYLLPLAAITLLFTAVDTAFSAALGVAVPLSNFPTPITAAIVLAARVLGMIAGFYLFWVMGQTISDGGGLRYLIPAAIGLCGFALLTYVALRAAQWVAVRGEVSPPARRGE
jgi:ABC-type Na+ efflux pump permease subunit